MTRKLCRDCIFKERCENDHALRRTCPARADRIITIGGAALFIFCLGILPLIIMAAKGVAP